MASIALTLPDGSRREVAAGTTVQEFAATSLPSSLVKKALAARLEAIVRRGASSGGGASQLTVGTLTLDLLSRTAS